MIRNFVLEWVGTVICYLLLASSVGIAKQWMPYWPAILVGPACILLGVKLLNFLHDKIFARKNPI